MRLFIAALSFLIGLYAITSAYMALLPPSAPAWQTGVGLLIGFIVSLLLTNKLVNAPGTDFWSLSRAPEPDEQSGQEGLNIATTYKATRCFEVEATGEEGPCYFIELQDGSVLYMNGRYLAGLAPHTLFYVVKQPRRFPCTEFIVNRDRYDGCVADIQCRGAALEPEAVTPPFEEQDFQNGTVPHDGDVLTTRTYDEMKAALEKR